MMKQRGEDGLTRIGDSLAGLMPRILPVGLFDEVIKPSDVGYTHPVFLQCFLPTRHSVRNRQRWQTNWGTRQPRDPRWGTGEPGQAKRI